LRNRKASLRIHVRIVAGSRVLELWGYHGLWNLKDSFELCVSLVRLNTSRCPRNKLIKYEGKDIKIVERGICNKTLPIAQLKCTFIGRRHRPWLSPLPSFSRLMIIKVEIFKLNLWDLAPRLLRRLLRGGWRTRRGNGTANIHKRD